MTLPIISCAFIGMFALIQVPLTWMVGLRRVHTNIQFFDGGDVTLLRRMRAHGNYTETVPIVLLAMLVSELSHMPSWALYLGGFSLLLGRLLHAYVIVRHGWGNGRAIGMLLTFAPMIGFGGWCLSRVFVS